MGNLPIQCRMTLLNNLNMKVLSTSQIDATSAAILGLIIYQLVFGRQSQGGRAESKWRAALQKVIRRVLMDYLVRPIVRVLSALASVISGSIGGPSMAQELRHETLVASIADGTSASNAAAEFRNDTAGMIHVRGADYSHRISVAGVNEAATWELSKAPTLQGETGNSPFFTYHQEVAREAGDGATALNANGDGRAARNGSKRWGRGQLTLEPNESLFMNGAKTSGGATQGSYTIEYEFA